MRIKIFSAPGDQRDDFEAVEAQVNEWLTAAAPAVEQMHVNVLPFQDRRDSKQFMMTVLVLYQ
jgi:hypothetical protein